VQFEKRFLSSGWNYVPIFLLCFLLALHFGVMAHFAVNIPYWDEWDELLERRQGIRLTVIFSFWIFCFVGFLPDWTFSGYQTRSEMRNQGLECVKQYYRDYQQDSCPTLHPFPLRRRLDRAKKLGLSFTSEGTALLFKPKKFEK
jgi:hypothetical protein